MKIEFYKHAINEDDIQNVTSVLKSTFLTTGPVTFEFERKLSGETGITNSVALSSCTAALHLSLLALGIGEGDEVITTPLTFIATATSILHTGAKPVFVDVEKETGLIDPDLIEERITSKTKAIIPVHLYGAMSDMNKIYSIAKKHNLKVIEDAAHCIEGERDAISPGMLSDGACFSFYATKNLTCGEGGAFITNNADLADKVRILRQHGMNKEAADRYNGGYQHWDMVDLGWKYNLDDIHSALLLNQIDRLETLHKKRAKLYNQYMSLIEENIPSIATLSFTGQSAYHLFTILVPSNLRDRILKYLSDNTIGVAVNYRAIHTLTWFKHTFNFKPEDYPNAFNIGCSTISLPFYPGLTMKEQKHVVKVLKNVLQNG